ncbi:hypothetical protein CKA32_000613 [Geitlerinema sp. FC II]|nr:hypothetical protein CKA32_000613 [Geitlerinema sp. FC II]
MARFEGSVQEILSSAIAFTVRREKARERGRRGERERGREGATVIC